MCLHGLREDDALKLSLATIPKQYEIFWRITSPSGEAKGREWPRPSF